MRNKLLKLINNASCMNKGNQGRDGVLLSHLNKHTFLRFYFSIFSFALVSIKKIYQTFKTMFDYIYLEFFKNTLQRVVFSTLFSVFGQTRCFVFDTSSTSRMPNTTLYPLLIHFLNKTSPETAENPSDNRQVKNTLTQKRRFS